MPVVLEEILSYKNSSLLKQFCYSHSQFQLNEASQLFHDLLGWLWLKQQRAKQDKPTYLFGPLLVLDELWHLFILHTRDYNDFSQQYFGEYVHHEPEPPGFEHHLTEEELADYVNDCFDYLGSDWVERRFAQAFILENPVDTPSSF